MKRRLAALLSLSIMTPCVFGSGQAFGFGIAVQDAQSNVNQMMTMAKQALQYSKQLEEYATQLKQLQNQVQNTIKPAQYLWDQVQQTESQVKMLTGVIDNFKQAGGVNAYLGNIMTAEEAARNTTARLAETAKVLETFASKAHEGNMKVIAQQDQALSNDALTTKKLQTEVMGANGQNQSLQVLGEIAANQSNQLVELRRMMLAEFQDANAERSIQKQDRAESIAYHKKVMSYHGPMPPVSGGGDTY